MYAQDFVVFEGGNDAWPADKLIEAEVGFCLASRGAIVVVAAGPNLRI